MVSRPTGIVVSQSCVYFLVMEKSDGVWAAMSTRSYMGWRAEPKWMVARY
jgi:hypothetical protein